MALKRKDIRAIIGDESLSDEEKCAKIIAGHIETVDGLNDTITSLKTENEKLKESQQGFDDLKAKIEEGSKWEEKYKSEHKAFEEYKTSAAKAASKNQRTSAYKAILQEIGISDTLTDLVTAASSELIDGIELDDDGKIKDSDTLKGKVKDTFSKYISEPKTHGADTKTPPKNTGKKMTKEEIFKIKDSTERQKAIAENHELFGF